MLNPAPRAATIWFGEIVTARVLLEGDGPLTQRVAQGIRAAIAQGRLSPGERVPSSRTLAASLGVSRNIVVHAFEELLAEGHLVSRGGAGTFVADEPPFTPRLETFDSTQVDAASAPRLSRFGELIHRWAPHRTWGQPLSAPIDFSYWHTTFDRHASADWSRLARKRISRLREAYPNPYGDAALRKAIAAHVVARRGINCAADDIVILNGAQQGLDLIARTLVTPGGPVLVEEPHYQGARQIFEAAGARVQFVPVDNEGLNIAAAGDQPGAVVFTTPSHQFPTGVAMSAARRSALLDWSARNGAWVIEDDIDSEYQHDGRHVAALKAIDANERVIYVSTFVRAFTTALRIGFLIAPRQLREVLVGAKWFTDRGTSEFEQSVLCDFIEGGYYERHLRRMGRLYRAKRETLVRALRAAFGTDIAIPGKPAGLHLYVRFEALADAQTEALVAKTREGGVGIYDAARYHVQAPECASVLLGFGAMPVNELEEGVKILARAYAQVLAGK